MSLSRFALALGCLFRPNLFCLQYTLHVEPPDLRVCPSSWMAKTDIVDLLRYVLRQDEDAAAGQQRADQTSVRGFALRLCFFRSGSGKIRQDPAAGAHHPCRTGTLVRRRSARCRITLSKRGVENVQERCARSLSIERLHAKSQTKSGPIPSTGTSCRSPPRRLRPPPIRFLNSAEEDLPSPSQACSSSQRSERMARAVV